MYQLCYAEGYYNGFLYFTDNFEHQWGDDWDDAPYEHNAGTPYKKTDAEDTIKGHGNIKIIAYSFFGNYEAWVKTPCSDTCNSPYSVKDINNGRVAWLYESTSGLSISGGMSMDKVISILEEMGAQYSVLG